VTAACSYTINIRPHFFISRQFVKGSKQVMKEARAGLRAYLLSEVFHCTHGSELEEKNIVAIFKHFDVDDSGFSIARWVETNAFI
jgi:hypothetical protein